MENSHKKAKNDSLTTIESPYKVLSLIYDKFMEGIDFHLWAEFIKFNLEKFYGLSPKTILELACGTGEMLKALIDTFPHSSIDGLDSSESMLEVAKRKLDSRVGIIRGRMENIKGIPSSRYEAVVLVNSSISYLTSMGEVLHLFKEIHRILVKGGVFYFDMASEEHINKVFKGSVFIEEGKINPDLSEKIMGENYSRFYCVWTNEYDEVSKTVVAIYDIFLEKDSKWDRFQEVHPQRLFEAGKLKRGLKEAGFKNIKILKNYGRKEENFRGFNFFAQKI